MVRMISIDVGEDGTNDSVHIEICSDVEPNCCVKLLDSFFNDFKSKKSSYERGKVAVQPKGGCKSVQCPLRRVRHNDDLANSFSSICYLL